MLDSAAIVAANRFGLGARPEEAAIIGRDPRGWLKAQLDGQRATPAALTGFPTATRQAREMLLARAAKGDGGVEENTRRALKEYFAAETGGRLQVAIDSAEPYRERLVHFWSNHFTVSVQRPVVGTMIGGFEREAIRPNILGTFADLLIAVTKHQAMLFYLDNAQSIGPNSIIGQRNRRGLNENLAREILELHTLGVDGGYTQDDVRALAGIITGWGVRGPQQFDTGAFAFQQALHEPGSKVLLGRTFAEDGMEEGEAALRFLAMHPATARHIAFKLARHFVADQPPPALVAKLAGLYLGTGGDLRALCLALVDLPDAWAHSRSKIRTPTEFVLAALRATASTVPPERLVFTMREMGQPTFAAQSPAGWPDTAADWVAPEAMLRRIEWAVSAGRRLPPKLSPVDVAGYAIGEAADSAVHREIAAAPSRAEGFALLFASAEFQRR